MVDFSKRYKDTYTFREPAIHFEQTGQYCNYAINTTEYFQYWDEQKKRCLDGYTNENGDYISGYNYFYINFCPIQRIVYEVINGKVKKTRKLEFPDFYDYDAYFFQAENDAEEEGKHLCVLKSRRKGYEQPYSELVATPKGFVKMMDIHAGDYVATAKGTYSKVLEEYEQGYKDVFKVTLDDGRQVTCGADHLWYVVNASNKLKPEVINTHDMLQRGIFNTYGKYNHYRYYLPEIKAVPYEEKQLPIHPYILGALLGDGTINKKGKSIKISTSDQEIVDEFTRLLGGDYELIKDKSCYNYRIKYKKRFDKEICAKYENGKFGVNPLSREITKLNLNVSCADKFIPEEYKYSSIEQRLELVKGLMDTDGTISTNGSCMFANTSKTLVYDLAQILRSLGIRCEINTYQKDGCKLLYRLYIRTYLPIFKLSRKLSRIKNKKINSKVAIINIERLDYQEKCKCILIEDEDHLYLTRDYIPTHNSYKAGSMACRNYYLIPGSKTYIYASNKQYLTEDGILTKAWDYMDFIDKNTAWGKKRSVNTTMRKRAGFYTKDEYGNEIELGYKSEIIGVTLKDNPDVVRGKAGKLIIFEEAGSFAELGAAWQIARPSVEQDGIAFGTMLAFGTGGDEDSHFQTLKDMFYNPDGYNCMEFDNIWDESATGTKCGFFIPQYTNLDIRDSEGKRLYMDKDGNTLHKQSIEFILSERRKVIQAATNTVAVDRYVAEHCITPQEACLEFGGNIFPKKELQEQLAKIRTKKELQNYKQVGDLIWTGDGQLRWIMKKTGDITHYPLKKDDDPTGSIVIWEHPMKDAPYGMYVAGIDSYDYDQSGTNSLGSCFIYKRFQSLESYSDIIVAEYTGRPNTAEEFYENVRKLLIYYNATAMYENQNKGLFVYFSHKHCEYLLADQPEIINDVVGNSTVQRKKGCHMNKQIKAWGEGLIKDWLNDTNIDGTKNLYHILSEPLLEELISYNDVGNFDRCITKDTLITTKQGYKKVQDIVIGDEVLTHNGKLEKVTWLDKHIHKGNKVTLRLVGDYRKLVCTDNHPILVAYTDKRTHKYRKESVNNINWLRADQLNYKYQFGLIPKRHLTEQIDLSPDILYLMGWIMSDGYVSTNGYLIRITYQTNQLNCATKCLNIIEDYLSDEQYYYSKNNTKRIIRKPSKIFRYKNCYRLEVHSKKLHSLSQWFGCNPNYKKLNPDIYNRYSNLMPFIIGWLEGDGHQKLNTNYDGYCRNSIEISTIYTDLLLQCRQIMIDNGIYSSIREVKPRLGKEQLNLSFSNEYINKCLDFYPSLKYQKITVYKNTSKVLETEQGFWSQIQLLSIEPIKEEVYNFEVEKSHSYIANGIVTHNCMAYMQLVIYLEQLRNIQVKTKEKLNKQRLLFDGPIFAQSQDDTELANGTVIEDNVYTFSN